MLFLERTDRTKVEDDFGLEFASSAGGPGPVPPAAEPMRTSIPPRHGPDPQARLTPSTPNTRTRHMSPFGSFLALQTRPKFRANEPVTRCLDRRAKCQSGTLMGATGGTQTHSRRTRSKLRQLRYARQGLVRVPESNTKYGGKRRKTGVASGPLCRQVSVSPQGFPSEKNCFHRANFGFVPLFTGQLFIPLQGLPRRDSREATGVSGLACPAIDGLALR